MQALGCRVSQEISVHAKEAAGGFQSARRWCVRTDFSGNPECCQARKGRVLACCEAAVLDNRDQRGPEAVSSRCLDVSLLDSPLPLPFLSLSIHYPLPVNPQNALNQMTSWRAQLHGIKIL